MKFRKKPVVIDAWAFLNDADSYALLHTLNEHCHSKGMPHVSWINDELIIPTLEGEMRASKGDWIIKGVEGELYPCKPDIFVKTYEIA